MTNFKKIFVVCSLVLSLLVTSSCGQEAISQNERNESSSTTSNFTEDSSNSKKFALAEIIVAEKTDKGTIRLSYMTNTISEDDTDSLFNNDYETDEDIKEGTYYKRTEYSDESSWNNEKNELKRFAESANSEDIVKKATTENFEYTPFGAMTDDSSNNVSSEPDTTKPNDSSSEGDKTTTAKKTSDSSKNETTKATTTTKKAETTTQYVYIPPTTTKSTTKATTKSTTKTTPKPASYIGKCHFCGKNITSIDGVYQGEFYICNTCKGSKCLLCGKACNSSIGKQQSDRYIGTHWFCYTCRPDLKPSTQVSITGTDADARREAQLVVQLTNKLRATNGRSQLKTDSRLTEAAMARAKELAAMFSHTRPNGTNGTTIIEQYAKTACSNGENIHMSYGTGYHDGEYVYQSFEDSPGHKATMLWADSAYIGVGVYYKYQNGYKYTFSVQLFCKHM